MGLLRCRGGYPLQCRRLFLLPGHLRGRAADGDGRVPGPYDVREYKVRSRGVTTNTCPMAPYRGVSRPAITLSHGAADGLRGGDARHRPRRDPPPQSRRHISLQDGTGLTYDEGSYAQTLDLAEEAIDIAAFRERQRWRARQGRYLGVGFSVFNERSGYGTPAFAARGRWTSRPATSGSRSPWTPPATSRSGSAPRRTARACSRRSASSSPTSSGSSRTSQRHPRRHRRDALWLGHFRQPFAW